MPFKLKLKKSRQYNVTSKSLFVISVYHLLDTSTAVDCTLSSESTGQECLENVCLRLSINQSEFFGLRFIVKGAEDEQRWIDLERPLSRQLEKYAAKTILFLRVMYYISPAIIIITDEVTRYYFYLQLKSDIVEGKLNCDPKQAIILASYCRQAEYDNHQRENHTVDYLKTLLPFPKHLVDAGLLETLTEEVLRQNLNFQNLTQSLAEEHLITACQQIDGYGQEKFIAANQNGNEVNLGITFIGISVSEETYTFYPWREITNIVNHKKLFNIECTDPKKSVSFELHDTETGRYVWKLSVLQHTMHRKCEMLLNSSTSHNLLYTASQENLTESKENLISDLKSSTWSVNESQQQLQQQQNYQWQQDSQNNLVAEQPLIASNLTIANSQQNPDFYYGSEIFDHSQSNWNQIPQSGSNISLNNHQTQSTSCLDLSNNNIYQETENRKAMLPLYRPAPDYETAVQQKYRASATELRLSTPMIQMPNEIVSDQQLNIYGYESQNDIHKISGGQQLRPHYPDVTQTTNPVYPQGPYGMNGVGQHVKLLRLSKPPPPPYPVSRINSTSTPDLALASQRAVFGYRGVYVSGSSPDLVSTRNFGRHNLVYHQKSNPFLYTPAIQAVENPRIEPAHNFVPPHGTFEQLNIIDHGNINPPSQIHKIYDGNKVIYCMPRNVEQLFIQDLSSSIKDQSQVLQNTSSSQQHINEAVEPIYENVPFSRQNDSSSEKINRSAGLPSTGIMLKSEKLTKMQPPLQKVERKFSDNNIDITKGFHEINLNSHKILSKTASNPIINRNESNHEDSHITSNEIESRNISVNNSCSSSNLDSSQSSSFSNIATSETKIEKRKKRWNILTRAKLGGSKNSDKQKSATLGREKDKSKKGTLSKEEENTKHRWSTGLPKSQSLPTDISKEKLCQLLEAKLADVTLFMEFEQIPKRKENARFECALNDENKNMNFDPDFLPYDDNRVKITPTRDNRLGYVNASHVTATVGSKQRFYIVAQSPRNSLTCNIFWKCVWEADVYLIIQLSDDLKYIPKNNERHLEYGQYQVWREFSQETDRCITSKLRLYHTQNRRYRSVWHISYLEWGDQNCPKNVVHFLDFLEELNSVRLASISEVPPGHNTNPPVMIHCGGGGGRAGVTLASDLLLYTLDHNQALNVPDVVKKLCEQRDKIIPSLAQYKFIYTLLIHYLKRNRLI